MPVEPTSQTRRSGVPARDDEPTARKSAVAVDLVAVPEMHDRGGTIRVMVTPKRTGAEHHIFGHAVLRPGEIIREHVHDYGEETIFVVRGAGTMVADDVEVSLLPDRLVFCPRGTRHAIRNDGGEELVMLFASAPLAPSPEAGHRETVIEAREE